MDQVNTISQQLNIPAAKIKAAIELLDSGNTLPFIARYRKEATGSLDEEQIRQISDGIKKLRALEDRKKTVVASIKEQKKLTPELSRQIAHAETLTVLEDLYQPYKPKRKTKAGEAREKGLQDLADMIISQPPLNQTLAQIAAPYVNGKVKSAREAWEGARLIAAEVISENAAVRQSTREKAIQWALLRAVKIKKAEDERGVFESYYDFEYKISKLRPHQILAINRGESLKVLRVSVEISERDWRSAVQSAYPVNSSSPLAGQLEQAIIDSAQRLLLPAIERDVRRALKETAETHAIGIFAKNLRGLLAQPPLSEHTILGLDPGYRTGCKIAVIDPTGKVLDTATIYPHKLQGDWEGALQKLSQLIQKHTVSLIAIGNGTASRESEELAAALIKEKYPNLKYLIVSEAGASVYSASKQARAELPDLDVSIRGAVSIARRVQDPLAELVKIDPQSIGVGLYQHDVDQKKLSDSLNSVVESVVNLVGVDLSTASSALLSHVSGIGPVLADKIVSYRDENGKFPDRASLKKVPGLGPKAYEQAAGFIRILDGTNALDQSAIHPESYRTAKSLMKLAGIQITNPAAARKQGIEKLLKQTPVDVLAKDLGVGVSTMQDILDQIILPGRDPRQDAAKPILRSDILSMEDLLPGIILKGTVRNVVDFGAFIDIGVKQDGLLHRSKTPQDRRLQVGDILEVEIQNIDAERGRIALGWVEET